MNAITICNTTIHQDEHGRYNLNDMHHAAGGEKRYQPSNFLRLDTTQALIDEINRSSDVRNGKVVHIVQGGSNQGTYVCKELTFAYAMWISPMFYLRVIRAYDALVTGQLANLPRPGQAEALRLERVARALAGELMRIKPERRKILRYRKMGLSVLEISRLLRRNEATIRGDLALLEACGLIEVTPQLEAKRALALANLPRGGAA